jgi:MoaA/NifB/PqqE/SkfB family radical SAM enzyme
MMNIGYAKELKTLVSNDYNYVFNVKNGNFWRWGTTRDDDPQWSCFGPEIADIEISTVCSKGCPWCYKSNLPEGQNMSLETFDKIISKFPQTLCQIAFGIGDIDGNPDLFKILRHCRRKLIVPNITINGSRLDVLSANKLATLCGSIAVSHYGEECFDAIALLKKEGAKQVNIHQLLAEETLDECWKLIDDPRLIDVHAVVFLSGKAKGRGKNIHPVSSEKFKEFVGAVLARNMNFGFDSCAAHKFLKSIVGHPREAYFKTVVEPCESGCFSIYINVEGKVYPCSFLENSWEPVDILEAKDFMKDVWNSKPITRFRGVLMNNLRACPVYHV